MGHDIMSSGNRTARSKYNLIQDWKIPCTGDSLHSFMSLCNYYRKFCPLFQLIVIPLRQLHIKFTRKNISQMEWTPELIKYFNH